MLRLCTQRVVHMHKGSLHLFKALHLSPHITFETIQGAFNDRFTHTTFNDTELCPTRMHKAQLHLI